MVTKLNTIFLSKPNKQVYSEIFRRHNNYYVSLIAVPIHGGKVIGSGSYLRNSLIRITAIPNNNFLFDHWSDGNVYASRLLNVISDITLSAVFIPYHVDDGKAQFIPNY